MNIQGCEWCGFCGADTEFDVSEDEWYIHCSCCGRPLLLCDKCHSLEMDTKCGACEHERKLDILTKAWEKTRIGRYVWYDNESDPFRIGVYKVLAFTRKSEWVLENINETGDVVTDFGQNIDFEYSETLSENKKINHKQKTSKQQKGK